MHSAGEAFLSLQPRMQMLLLLLRAAAFLAPAQSLSEAAAEPPSAATVSAELSLVWGPGLRGEQTLPVRYFYIQAVSSDGRNLTRSPPPGSTQFKVTIKAISPKEIIQVHVPKLLDRNDGSFLMRYRMYGSVMGGLKVEILYGDAHVAQSPYIVKGPVYHEYCECPEEDAQLWEKKFSCPPEETQITEDFIAFPSINLQRMFHEVPSRFGQKMGAIVHYTILNNHIYRRSLGKYTDFKMFSDEMLLSLARKVRLPDIEFYLNVGDWPVEHRKANDSPGPLPIISWCGSLDTADIVLPTYEVTHSTFETLRGVTNDLLSIQGNTGPVWENKTEQGFFRGRDSREERLQLVQLSKENPDLLDAGITNYFFFREKEKELGKAPLMGFFDFFKYKYQVSVDGTVAAYRFPYLLLGDSLVLKQDSQYYEHFYTELAPWSHYVPVKRNLQDLLKKIKWSKRIYLRIYQKKRKEKYLTQIICGTSLARDSNAHMQHAVHSEIVIVKLDLKLKLPLYLKPAVLFKCMLHQPWLLTENDEEVRKIAKEGQRTARELLQPHRFYCYYFKVFQKYAERQASKPEIRDGMEFVPQPDDRTSICDCHRKKPSREEL